MKIVRRKGTIMSDVSSDAVNHLKGNNNLFLPGDVDFSKSTPEDRIRAMIEDLIEKDALEETMEALERYSVDGDEKRKAFVELFKKVYEEFKKEKSSEKLANKMESLVVELEKMKKHLDEIFALDKIKEVISKKDADINSFVEEVKNALQEYNSKKGELNSTLDEYKKLYGDYTISDVSIFISEDEIKNRYTEIAREIMFLTKKVSSLDPADNSKKAELESKINSLNNLVFVLPSFLEKPDNFKAIKDSVDSSLRATPLSKDEEKEKLYNELKSLVLGVRDGFLTKLKALDYSIIADIEDLNKKRETIFGNYASLTKEEKEEVAKKVTEEVKLFSGIDRELYMAILDKDGLLDIIHNEIEPMYAVEFKQDEASIKEFYEKLAKLKQVVDKIKNLDALKKYGAKVEFNEVTLTLNIEFPNLGIKYSKQVVKDETYKNYQTYEVDKILDNYILEVSTIYDDKMFKYFAAISRLEKFDNTFDALIDSKGREYAQKIKDLNVSEQNAILSIQKINNRIASASLSKHKKEDLDIVRFVENELVGRFAPIKTAIADLSKVEFSNPEFAGKYEALQKMIKEFINYVHSDENKKYGINIIYDETTERLAVDYNCSLLSPYSLNVLSNEALLAKNASRTKGNGNPNPAPAAPTAGTPGPNPGPNPVPAGGNPVPSEEKLKDQQMYMELIEVLNDKIKTLNSINAQLLTLEDNITLSDDFVQNNILYERKARELDFEIISSKTELSTLRAQYSRKYKELLYQNPDIKNKKIEEIVFPGNCQEFIEKHDTLIVEAELKIAELSEQKKDNPSEEEAINKQIKTLLTFIDCQNSIVGRRLIAEGQNNKIDLVQMLEKRREFKKQLRENLRNKDKKHGTPKPDSGSPTPSDDKPKADPAEGVSISNRQLNFNPRKVRKIDRTRAGIIAEADMLVISVIKNGIKIKYSRDLAKKLQEVKARLALVNKKNYRVRTKAKLGIADEDTLVETDLAFTSKPEIDVDDYKVEIRNDDGILYDYDLAQLPEEEKHKSR